VFYDQRRDTLKRLRISNLKMKRLKGIEGVSAKGSRKKKKFLVDLLQAPFLDCREGSPFAPAVIHQSPVIPAKNGRHGRILGIPSYKDPIKAGRLKDAGPEKLRKRKEFFVNFAKLRGRRHRLEMLSKAGKEFH
jgi:hypothetical protein